MFAYPNATDIWIGYEGIRYVVGELVECTAWYASRSRRLWKCSRLQIRCRAHHSPFGRVRYGVHYNVSCIGVYGRKTIGRESRDCRSNAEV